MSPLRRWILLGLVSLVLTSAAVAHAEDLGDARDLLRSRDAKDRTDALEILVRLNSRRAVTTLEDAVRRSLSDIERLAPTLDALDLAYGRANHRGKRAARAAWRKQQDVMNAHLDVILAAGRALQKFTSSEAIETIEQGVQGEQVPLLRLLYIQALSTSGRHASVPVLLEVSDASDPRVRALAVRALRRFVYFPGVAACLRHRAEDRVWSVRMLAYGGMAFAPFDVAVPFLIEGIAREEGEVALRLDALLASHTGISFADDVTLWARWWKDHEAKVRDGTYVRPPPPASPPHARRTATFFRLPLHSTNILFAIDYSGSMNKSLRLSERRINQAREAHGLPATRLGYAKTELIHAIQSLPDGARFNIVLYGDEARTLSKRPLIVSSTTRNKAIRWILRRDTQWMTNMWSALRESFYDHLGRSGGSQRFERLPDTVVFLTDGFASRGRFQDDDPLRTVVQLWNMAAGVVIHTVGIGNHDKSLLKTLARSTGGIYLDLAAGTTSLKQERPGIEPVYRMPHRLLIRQRLQQVLAEGDWEARLDMLRVASRLGAFAGPLLPLIVSALANEDSDVRDAAASALALLGADAVPHLVVGLDHADPIAIEAAVRTLTAFGPDAAPAVPRLGALLTHQQAAVRAAAAAALGAVGSGAKEAIAALEAATMDGHAVVARAARDALRAVGAGD